MVIEADKYKSRSFSSTEGKGRARGLLSQVRPFPELQAAASPSAVPPTLLRARE